MSSGRACCRSSIGACATCCARVSVRFRSPGLVAVLSRAASRRVAPRCGLVIKRDRPQYSLQMTHQLPRTTYLIGRLDRTVRRALEDLIRDQDVTVLGFTALTVLAARPGLSNAQLARRSFMTPQGMNQAMAVLAERGLVDRRPDERNRRVQRLQLTPEGAQVVAVCSDRVERFEQQLLAALTVDEQAELNALLRRVVEGTRMAASVTTVTTN